MPLIRANGLDVHYTVDGAGPPLLMLHGATSSAEEDWSAQLPLFKKAFRVHLVDARGHAGTKWDVDDGFSRDMLVDDLLALVDELGLETFHLVGFSMGAMTALTFATRYPERLRTAMICGIDIAREPRTSVARRLMDPERIEREEPQWAAQLERRHGPVQGTGRLEEASAGDRRRRCEGTLADVPGSASRAPAGAARLRRSGCLRAGRSRGPDVSQPARCTLLIAPNSPHTVMVNQPALFNQAAANFYRSTEQVARQRASHTADQPHTESRRRRFALRANCSRGRRCGPRREPFSNW